MNNKDVPVPSYRADIDGLRAIAVLSVLAYHLRPGWLPGGFTGVDIFFVISGYLITSIVRREIEQGTFSFAAFYLRRVRRIAPAMLVVTAATLAVGHSIMLPEDLYRLARSALWCVLGLGNVHFWLHLDTDYFADSSEEEPLLHLWSLGVEEQFYFLWPALLLLLWRREAWRTKALVSFGLLVLAAFACAEITADSSPEFAFYMLPARAGELLAGSLLALRTSQGNSSSSGFVRLALAVAGCSLVAYSLFSLDGTTRFPGVSALPAVLGTVVLIHLGARDRENPVVRVLSLPPLVFVGRISYSLYLIHWPLLAFYRYTHGHVDTAAALWIALASIILATASYYLIETPARNFRGSGRVQWVALVVMLLAIAAPGVWLLDASKTTPAATNVAAEGISDRRSLTSEVIRRETAAARSYPYNCQINSFSPEILEQARCITGHIASPPVEPRVLLWGDSMAAHYLGALSAVAEKEGVNLRNATHSGCPPVFFGVYGASRYKAGCTQFRPFIREALMQKRFDRVVMSASWSAYAKNRDFERDVTNTVEELAAHGVEVVLIGEAPRFPDYNKECELRAVARQTDPTECQRRSARSDVGPPPFSRILERLADEHPGVAYLDIRSLLCHDGQCSPYVDARPAYYDAGHLSMDGSWRLGRMLYDDAELRRPWARAVSAAVSRDGVDDQRHRR